MKKLDKHLPFISSVLLVAGYAGVAYAHTKSEDLAVGVGLTDKYTVSCPSPGSQLFAQILDTTGSADGVLLTVTISKASPPTSPSTDNDDGGNANPSTGTTKADGSGTYNMWVTKNGNAFQSYTVTYHCQNSGGTHTTTSLSFTQDQ